MTDRYYGWKPSSPDQRDLVYSAPRPQIVNLPPAVNLCNPLPPYPLTEALDQQSLGSCGPHAAVQDVAYALQKQGITPCPMPSRLFVYYNTRMIMGTVNQDSGVDNRSLMKALAQYGWCEETLWLYDISQFKTKPPASAYEIGKLRKIDQYLSVPQDLTQMRACLAGGDPFIFGFTVYESFEYPETVSTGIVPMPRMGESVLGGHDVWFVGYSDEKQVFILRNSWDETWGVHGFGTMPYAYATSSRLSGDFWTAKHSLYPSPTPPTPPVTNFGPITVHPNQGTIDVTGDWKINKVA